MDVARADGLDLLLESVTKTYQPGRPPANSDITLLFGPGQLVALLGHNGAGKTTLLNQIVGTTKPTSGTIRYGSHSLVGDPDLARRVSSMMPQIYAPLTGVTPAQAITSIGRLRGLSPRAARRATDELLDALDITQWRNRSGEKVSGGLRRLTSYAMAVVAPAPVLLIDEPTNDVDPVRRPLIWRSLRNLADDGHIVIVVTHNLVEVERAADRYVLLQDGRVLVDSTPRELAKQAGATTLTVTMKAGVEPSRLPSAINISGAEEPGQLRLALTMEQVPAAVDWVLRLAREEQADTYSLAPSSLESLYERMTNVN